ILKRLGNMGVEWVQMDEPILITDMTDDARTALKTAYALLSAVGPKLLVASYFDGLRDNTDLALSLPVAALHVDVRRSPDQLTGLLAKWPQDKILSLGVVDGRNIWRTNLRSALGVIGQAVAKLWTDRVWVAPSCSLLHAPIDLDHEVKMDQQLKSWLAFGKQKLNEISCLTKGINEGESAIQDALLASDAVVKDRLTSPRIHDSAVQNRLKALTPAMAQRHSAFSARSVVQRNALGLPLFPTTTIGSFPQTKDIREARAAFKKGTVGLVEYNAAMKKEIETVVRFQEDIGIDVLVHGEPERNDMVEYFGEQLKGYTFSQNGWVQSYGSRCVKPPIIFGDVSR
ncbi:MAG: 5-methyltetrahydropteroyltriglutamate--homocysteine S-methyltransferase, partial [Pseudomonadota bacterium]